MILRRGTIPLLLALIVCGPSDSPAENSISPPRTTNAPADISAALTAACTNSGVPGMVAVVLRGDAIIAQGAAGIRKAGSDTPITFDDRFHLGSDTKAMTATLMALLVEERLLRWDSTVGEIFAEKIPRIHEQWKNVTLDQLLTHRSGAPENLNTKGLWLQLWLRRGTPSEQRLELARGVLTIAPASVPGTHYLYSNAGYALAGAMAEIVTGKPWEQLMETRVFAPLGITTAGFGAPGTEGKIDQPLGHTAGGKFIPVGPLADNPPAIGPAGTVHMNIADWARFTALHLQGDPANPNQKIRLLKKESFAHLHSTEPDNSQRYAGGWMIVERSWAKGKRTEDRGIALTHSGSNTMWFCIAWLAPERDFAMLVACNRGGDLAGKTCDQIVGEMIKKFAELP